MQTQARSQAEVCAPQSGCAEMRGAERFALLIRTAKLVSESGEFLCVVRDVSASGEIGRAKRGRDSSLVPAPPHCTAILGLADYRSSDSAFCEVWLACDRMAMPASASPPRSTCADSSTSPAPGRVGRCACGWNCRPCFPQAKAARSGCWISASRALASPARAISRSASGSSSKPRACRR